jgi:hypothetical protein
MIEMTDQITIRLPYGTSGQKTVRKVERLCARAAKKGLSGGWHVASVETITETDPDTLVTRYYDVLTLQGEPFAYEGWKFVARVEWLEGLPFVSLLPGYEGEDVSRYDVKPGHCDHCGTNRQRNAVYIVESADGRQQVGSSCLKDFTGHDVAAAFESIDSDSDEESFGSSSWRPEASTIDVLAVALRIVREEGYCSKKSALGTTKTATSESVSEYLWRYDSFGKEYQKKIGALTDDDRTEAVALRKWITTEFSQSGDYAENLRIAATLDVTTPKTLGTLVSAIAAKDIAVEREATKANSSIIEERYAADGEKITVEVDVSTVRWIQGFYGTFAYVTFVTDTHRFKWKATGASVPEEGTRIRLTGTVKGTDEFNSATFTVLTRCKFEVIA